eukprot:TRINITY_DN6397_c0_g1_i2.p1 TRINITY_DN6397_c0_g1~~TRINITY_DN6397_c0_g1_i2.p1  ORF type:complete len:209 (-),score=72.16 TRINITY_DN6397_c0_g1_i2:10-636(-)
MCIRDRLMRRKGFKKNKNISKHVKSSYKKISKTKLKSRKLKQNWNPKISVEQNMKNEGLYSHINQRISEICKAQTESKKEDGKQKLGQQTKIEVEEVDIKELQRILQQQQSKQQNKQKNDNIEGEDENEEEEEGQNKKEESKVQPKIKLLTLDEKQAVKLIIQKYGENYKKAQFDSKCNKFQWNKNQIKRKVELYNKQQKLQEQAEEQ